MQDASLWRCGRITVEWPITVMGWWRAAGVIRVHNDINKIPGDYNCSGSIIVKDWQYEIMGFTVKGKPPSKSEFKAVYGYLRSLGLQKRRHVRAKGGRVYVVQPAVFHHQQRANNGKARTPRKATGARNASSATSAAPRGSARATSS